MTRMSDQDLLAELTALDRVLTSEEWPEAARLASRLAGHLADRDMMVVALDELTRQPDALRGENLRITLEHLRERFSR